MRRNKLEKIYVVTNIHFGYKYADKDRNADGKFHSYEIRTSKTQRKYFTIIDKNTVGWFKKFEDAEKSVLENCLDMYEGEYEYTVIEESFEGLLSFDDKGHWYKWNGTWEEGGYKKSKKPKTFSNVVGFGY
jgi:hypothetical protein